MAVVRHRLVDGYSDNVIEALHDARLTSATRVIVLIAADTSSAQEARQLALGADCVHRDPIRSDVLAGYLSKYQSTSTHPRAGARPVSHPQHFAGAILAPLERTVRNGKKQIRLTPREVELAEVLLEFDGEVVPYQTLYSEILGRRFRGETSNMRVLLGKLASSFRAVGIDLRRQIEVIPKAGYRYRSAKTVTRKP